MNTKLIKTKPQDFYKIREDIRKGRYKKKEPLTCCELYKTKRPIK